MGTRPHAHDVFGVSMTLQEIASLSGLPETTLRDRIDAGWPMRNVLFLPARSAREYRVGEEMLTIEEMSARSGRDVNTIRAHMARGATAEEAFAGIKRGKRCQACNEPGHRSDACKQYKGSVHGMWTVLRLTSNGRALCRCECGTEREILTQTIREKTAAASCGCTSSLVGAKVGMLLVLEDGEGARCLCQCACGSKPKMIRRALLASRRVQSCGCLRLEAIASNTKQRHAAMVGTSLGGSGIILVAPPESGDRRWTCRCHCGELFRSTAHEIRAGHTTSCGCTRGKRAGNVARENAKRYSLFGQMLTVREISEVAGVSWETIHARLAKGDRGDALLRGKRKTQRSGDPAGIIGRVMGRLTVERYTGISSGATRAHLYDCLCACGQRKIAAASNLKSGRTGSCGCLQRERATGRPMVTA